MVIDKTYSDDEQYIYFESDKKDLTVDDVVDTMDNYEKEMYEFCTQLYSEDFYQTQIVFMRR